MRLKADLTLLLVALVWGSAFVAQRVAAQNLGVFLFNGLRFLLGALVLLPLVRSGWRAQGQLWRWAGLAGGLLFAASAFQQAGMQYTSAANAGFITGLYVVFVPLILLVLRQRLGWTSWAAAWLAAVGVFFLSGGGRLRLAPGDGLELVGALIWAAHVVTIGKAVQHVDVLRLSIGQYLVTGVFNLLLGLGLEGQTLPAVPGMWLPIVYTGVFSIALGYTLQAWGQRHSPPADTAILLSLEAVFAALFGYFLLGEVLSAIQVFGCALILAAILLTQARRAPQIAGQPG